MSKSKKEQILISAKVDNFFNVEDFIKNEPDAFDELVKKYPLKECAYLIINKNKQVEVVEEEPTGEIVEEPVVEEVKEAASAPEGDVIEDWPENFKPLYEIGETIKISYAYNEKNETITISEITAKHDENGKVVGYYYTFLVAETGEQKCMGEDFLTGHEVLNA